MCSVCALLSRSKKAGIRVQHMGRVMRHRGPDAEGVWTHENCALQHNRLQVMDPENGTQPMTVVYEGVEYTIVYNGEIYNVPELAGELRSFGVELRTRCDTEAVLWAFAVWGEDCLSHLNGIFAFCVYNSQSGELFYARDRLGVKPLFFTRTGEDIAFASEVKALLRLEGVRPRIGYEGIWQLLFLAPARIPGTTCFEEIYEVEPGECGWVREEGRIQRKRYWHLTAAPCADDAKTATERVRELMTDIVRRQIVSDVPLCTFLSGGLDSSVVTALAQQEYRKQGLTLSTYSFEYEGSRENFTPTLFQPNGDEDYALWLAGQLGTEHTVLTAPTERIAALLADAVRMRDLPGQADIDSSLLYFCSEVKRRHTVALSGECADEIFGGYPWFYRKEMLERDFFPWIHEPMARISLFDTVRLRAEEGYAEMCRAYKRCLADCSTLPEDSESMLTSRRATVLSVGLFMTNLLERKDRMSMASGLEVRVPFSDHRLLEYVYNLPWEIKFENQTEKALLRRAMEGILPERILYRKKSPYPKTRNPAYEKRVWEMLSTRLESKNSLLRELLNAASLQSYLQGGDVTWFGQLMSRPQMMAWLYQLDCFFEAYRVELAL